MTRKKRRKTDEREMKRTGTMKTWMRKKTKIN